MKPYFGHFRRPGPPKTPLKPLVPVNSKCFTAMDQLVPVSFEQDMISCGVAFESLSWGELNATIFWEFGCPWYCKVIYFRGHKFSRIGENGLFSRY